MVTDEVEYLAEKFKNELSIACIDELVIDVDVSSFYKFNLCLYLDDEFRASFYESHKETPEVVSLNNVTLVNTDMQNVASLTCKEREILNHLNNLDVIPLYTEKWVNTAMVQINSVKHAVNIVIFDASVDRAALVPEILRKKSDWGVVV